MLSIFRTNEAYAGLLLFFYALLLQLPYFFIGTPLEVPTAPDGLLGQWLMAWVGERRWLALFLPVLLIFLQGLQANALVSRHRLSRTVTQFPGLFLVLAWGIVPAFRWLHPVQVANVFLFFSLLSLGRVYKKEEPAVALFNAGAWLAMASFFAPCYLLFLPPFLIAIGILRRPDMKSILRMLIGILLFYFLVGVWTYQFGHLGTFLESQFSFLGWPELLPVSQISLFGLGLSGFILLLLIFTFSRLTILLNVEGSKGVSILYWILLFSVVLVGVGNTAGADMAQTATAPLGVLLGLSFVEMPHTRANLFHLFLLMAAVLPAVLILLSIL